MAVDMCKLKVIKRRGIGEERGKTQDEPKEEQVRNK
jgi:hypothetical protein